MSDMDELNKMYAKMQKRNRFREQFWGKLFSWGWGTIKFWVFVFLFFVAVAIFAVFNAILGPLIATFVVLLVYSIGANILRVTGIYDPEAKLGDDVVLMGTRTAKRLDEESKIRRNRMPIFSSSDKNEFNRLFDDR